MYETEALTLVAIKNTLFCDMKLYSLIEVYWHFRGMLVNFCQAPWCHIQKVGKSKAIPVTGRGGP
jgi:hypothetical protein